LRDGQRVPREEARGAVYDSLLGQHGPPRGRSRISVGARIRCSQDEIDPDLVIGKAARYCGESGTKPSLCTRPFEAGRALRFGGGAVGFLPCGLGGVFRNRLRLRSIQRTVRLHLIHRRSFAPLKITRQDSSAHSLHFLRRTAAQQGACVVAMDA